jgi:hypothetical protein
MLIEELQYLMEQQHIHQNSSVCKLRCKFCNKIYTGQVESIFHVRINKHYIDIRTDLNTTDIYIRNLRKEFTTGHKYVRYCTYIHTQ